ncbi:MAG: 3'(2'),5'-bisphosphate nucleotidase CysQ [Candidatus Promineifilaceae bacterium]
MDNLLSSTITIVEEAGRAIMSYYEDSFSVTEKSPDNPVTDADLAADTLLKHRLLAIVPEAGWLSEETADTFERLDKQFCWVVDPLDGTKEFVLGIPEFTVSVALIKDGEPVLAVIYNPATDELFHASRGKGSEYKGARSYASQRENLVGAKIEASRSERLRGEFEPFEPVVNVQTMGSIAYKLARVSAGLVDGTWSRGPKNEWDICAGVLLVEEAGGRCVDLDDNPISFNRAHPKVNGIIADNSLIHDEVIAALAPHRSTARVD